MASSIEWLNGGETWNPIRARNKATGKAGWFCTKPSPGCANCYAEMMNKNTYFGNGIRYAVDQKHLVELFLDEKTLMQPLHWKKPRLIFPCSMTDWMADFVPDEWRDKMLAVMALTPQHTYLTLTKRADRQQKYLTALRSEGPTQGYVALIYGRPARAFPSEFKRLPLNNESRLPWPLPNFWLGVSTEDQKRADERIPELLQTPAAIRWVSLEPLLGPIDFDKIVMPDGDHLTTLINWGEDAGIDWVVAGGESGPNARPMHPDWARSLRDQCKAAGVPFFFKQWGEFVNGGHFAEGVIPRGLEIHDWNDGKVSVRAGKKTAGRKLDGIEHSEYPPSKGVAV